MRLNSIKKVFVSYFKKSIVKFNLTLPKWCIKQTDKILKLIKLVHKKSTIYEFFKKYFVNYTYSSINNRSIELYYNSPVRLLCFGLGNRLRFREWTFQRATKKYNKKIKK